MQKYKDIKTRKNVKTQRYILKTKTEKKTIMPTIDYPSTRPYQAPGQASQGDNPCGREHRHDLTLDRAETCPKQSTVGKIMPRFYRINQVLSRN